MEGVTLIAARRFQLPGGGETAPGDELEAKQLGTEVAVRRLLRTGFLFGYDAAGEPIRESRDFRNVARLAPKRAAAPSPPSEERSSPGGAEPASEEERAGDGAVAPEPAEVAGSAETAEPETALEPEKQKPTGGKRRRKKPKP